MSGEVTVPLLPCASIDDVADFYLALGFEATYRQLKPNPYVALRRDDLHLHFFGMPGFDPTQSYGSCLVVVADTRPLYEAFAAGMRATYGKVLTAGIPRMTRPRRKQGNTMGFMVVDPGGNWIRVVGREETADAVGAEAVTRLGRSLHNAVVLGDSKGDDAQAARILDGALGRDRGPDRVEEVAALVYRLELAVRLREDERARALLDEVRAVPLDAAERERAAEDLRHAAELDSVRHEPVEPSSGAAGVNQR